MATIDMACIAIIYATAFAILLIGYYAAVSSKDVIRLLISLEMMFGAVLLALLPLFSVSHLTNTAFGIAIITLFASSGELLVLISAITILDRQKKDIHTKSITTGGDDL